MFSDNKSLKELKDKKYLKYKDSFVHNLFENMAKDYDAMNEVISFGRNLSIKKQVISNVPIKPDSKILDVCTGTGDMAILLSKYIDKSGYITGVDFSKNMIEIANQKTKGIKNVEFIEADALNLPFKDNSFDVTFISYGLRNLADLNKGILEMKRVTKENGYVVNFDFGKSKPIYNDLFKLYFLYIVPLFKSILKKDFTFYRYIPPSNDNFPSQETLVKLFQEFKFKEVKNYNFAWGQLAQQVAKV